MDYGLAGERGFTLWFTGLSGAGKTTVAEIVERELRRRMGRVEVLERELVRREEELERNRNDSSNGLASLLKKLRR